MAYLRAHWRGDLSLHISIWINLVLIRCAVLLADKFTLPPYLPDRDVALPATIMFMLLCHGGVYAWQVIGLLRACERQRRGVHATLWVWTGYLMILMTFIFTLLSVMKAYQALDPRQFIVDTTPSPAEARAAQYTLELSQDGQRVHITGIIALGMGDKLRALLDANPDVTNVVLNSGGGHVYEGRGVAYLIKERRLDTYVLDTCKSACTTAFMGGAHRHAGAGAKIGFHQYGLGQWLMMNTVDIASEQSKDINFYRSQGIDEDFLERVFDAAHEDIWFPSMQELMDSGVIHGIRPPSLPAQ